MMQVSKLALAVCVIGAGMLGLHHGIEYSGWVLLVGCLAFVGFT